VITSRVYEGSVCVATGVHGHGMKEKDRDKKR
jgi:hypothetical protein